MILDSVKVPIRYTDEDLIKACRKAANDKKLKIKSVEILLRSIDARKKPELYYVMKLKVNEPKEALKLSLLEESQKVVGDSQNADIAETVAAISKHDPKTGKILPVAVIGAGPCGLFAALTLSEAGIPVVLLERGKCVEERTADVEKFFNGGALNPDSNVQFGEGGAGTFSDGKLNTRVHDPNHVHELVLNTFVHFGAPDEIRYDSHPHIGTDALKGIIRNMRDELLSRGVDVRFQSKVTRFLADENHVLTALEINGNELNGPEFNGQELNNQEILPVSAAILAIGHSARDTFEMLLESNVSMEQKPFAVGLRMEHLQKDITFSQYGTLDYEELGAAPYKVTAKASDGRGVYSFCMCPGGYVVNASSEPGHLCVNGMSEKARDSLNANSGIVVQVTPSDYPGDDPLAGVRYQRELERKAFLSADGQIPVQRYGDFAVDRESTSFGRIVPQMKGGFRFAKMSDILPETVSNAIKEAIPAFGRMIKSFDDKDALLSAVEARTSSPVRIIRDENGESSISLLFPAGEGAGYAGGITSAAMDGILTARKVLSAIRKKQI